jgi:GntR family transcriptional regulator, carbon starvation induced regulator
MLFGKRDNDDDTVVAMLASAIRRDIAFGHLPPDQKLKIEALRQRYGGSNHSMRETLRVLSADGLVEATSQRGFRVTSATQQDLEDILLMRLEIEKLGLARSMENASVQWEGAVIAAFHALRHADRQVQNTPDDLTALEWDEACRQVFMALLSACLSPRLIDMAGKFYDQSRRFRLACLREGHIDFAAREVRQKELCEAILAKDQTRALALLDEEIRTDIGKV